MTNKQINKEECIWEEDRYLEWKTGCKKRWTGHFKAYSSPFLLSHCKFCGRKIKFED